MSACRTELQKRGKLAREWACGDEAGFTAEKMCYKVINNLDTLFETWVPREKFNLIKADTPKKKYVPHNLIY